MLELPTEPLHILVASVTISRDLRPCELIRALVSDEERIRTVCQALEGSQILLNTGPFTSTSRDAGLLAENIASHIHAEVIDPERASAYNDYIKAGGKP